MSEIQKLQNELIFLKTQEVMLHPLVPHISFGCSLFLLLEGASRGDAAMQGLGIFTMVSSAVREIVPTSKINATRFKISEKYFNRAKRLHQLIDSKVCTLYQSLPKASNTIERQKITSHILSLKRQDTIRQADSREVLDRKGLGHKQRGLAKGLKFIRKNISFETAESYRRKRNNVLSYY